MERTPLHCGGRSAKTVSVPAAFRPELIGGGEVSLLQASVQHPFDLVFLTLALLGHIAVFQNLAFKRAHSAANADIANLNSSDGFTRK